MDLLNLVCILVGSAFGGGARHAVCVNLGPRLPSGFPWAVIVVNWSGAAFTGLLWPYWGELAWFEWGTAIKFLIVGLLGGYTTVSSFALDSWQLIRTGRHILALKHLILTLGGCLLALRIGVIVSGL